jgi:hypothetical protein
MISTGDVTQFNQGLPETDYDPPGEAGDSMGFQITFKTTTASTIAFSYIFTSSELPKYMGSAYNDNFEMRLTNTNTKETHNIAYLPARCYATAPSGAKVCNNPDAASGNCHVTINNLGMKTDQSLAGSLWSPCYVDNPTGKYFAGYKGYTQELQATYALAANSPYTLNITITDVNDGKYDSVVFLEANTFSVVPTIRRTEMATGSGTAGAPQGEHALVAAPSGQHSTATLAGAVVGSVAATAAITLLIAFAVLRRRKGALAAELPAQSHELHTVTTANHVGPCTRAAITIQLCTQHTVSPVVQHTMHYTPVIAASCTESLRRASHRTPSPQRECDPVLSSARTVPVYANGFKLRSVARV